MAVAGQMNEIEGVVAQWNFVVVHDHLDSARPQPTLHLSDVGGALLARSEEAPIVGSRLQDDDFGAVRHFPVESAEHHGRGVEGTPAFVTWASICLARSSAC